MKIFDLRTFQKEIPNFPLCLVICKDEGERKQIVRETLKSWQGGLMKLEGSSFSIEFFMDEVDTLPFLSKHKVIFLDGVDLLSKQDLDKVYSYAEKPNGWIRLLLTCESPLGSKFTRLIEDKGVVLHIKEEKPWEKEKRTAHWLVDEALRQKVNLPSSLAEAIVKQTGCERIYLESELQKLLCYIGENKQITMEDFKAISSSVSHETIWQLGDAIFAKRRMEALKIANALFADGEIIFPLLANLRTQINTGIEVLSLYHSGGQAAVQKSFPYLKGGFFSKKLKLFQGYGFDKFKQALVHLYQTEIASKNSGIDPQLLIEMLVVKLT